MKTLFLILLFLVSVVAQDKLPEYGDISDLQGLSRVFVTADTTASRNFVLEELKKFSRLQVVNRSEDSDFIIECRRQGELKIDSGLIQEMPEYEMTVYTLRDNKRRIAWSKTKISLRPPQKLLTRDFIKAFKKLSPNDDRRSK